MRHAAGSGKRADRTPRAVSEPGGSPVPGVPPGSRCAAVSVCVVCCTTISRPHDAALAVARALRPLATVRTILLSVAGDERPHGAEVVPVPGGTKLSKLQGWAARIPCDLVCICDPDLTIEGEACREVLRRAMDDVRAGREAVAFGIVEGRDDGTLLARAIAVDKWLSHRVLRPALWGAGLGITLPGQFLIVSPGLLRSLDPRVDSHLDDLYLGWVARRRGASVRRVPAIVGREDPRSGWSSLLTQRCRWMRGLASLALRLARHPAALGLLGVHAFAYHAVPVLAMTAIATLAVWNPLAGACAFFAAAAALGLASGQSFAAAVVFLIAFPFVHLYAALLWWVPVDPSFLARR